MNSSGTILIVEDASENLQLLSRLLTDEGYHVRATQWENEALLAINELIPEVILLDIKVSAARGYEACQTLKSNEKTHSIPIIVISNLNDTATKLRGFALGAVDFITKPYVAEEVVARVKTHLSLSQLYKKFRDQTSELQTINLQLRTLEQQQIEINQQLSESDLLSKKQQNLLDKTGSIAKIGGWEIDLITDELTWTKEVFILHEVDQSFKPTVEKAISFYSPQSLPIIEKAVKRAIEFKESFDLELEIITAKGNIVPVRAIGEYSEEGINKSVFGVFQDIRERRLAEKEKAAMQSQLIHSDKLASIGTLAAGIAHEINNPLMIISGNAQRLKEKCPGVGKDGYLENITKIIAATERVASIVKGLRTYSRLDADMIHNVDMHRCIKETLSLVENIYEKDGVKLETDLKADAFIIKANTGKLQQVLINLLGNAKDAVNGRKNGLIRVATKNQNGCLVLEVVDNGSGIAEEIIPKLFEPFFTTKEPGKGTGLGLSISHSIVESFGGKIEVKTTDEVGTTFKIVLPAIRREKEMDKEKEQEKEKKLFKISGKALVVDDEEGIREILSEYLKTLGLEVFAASDGAAAYKLTLSENFDYIFTDMKMPGMNGYELLNKIKLENLAPGAKCLIVTGGLESFSRDELESLEKHADGFIYKPVEMIDIIRILIKLSW